MFQIEVGRESQVRPPDDKERVVCPVNGEKLKPESCWASRLPNGQTVTYGLIPKFHKHKINGWGASVEVDCEWAGLPAPQPVEVI